MFNQPDYPPCSPIRNDYLIRTVILSLALHFAVWGCMLLLSGKRHVSNLNSPLMMELNDISMPQPAVQTMPLPAKDNVAQKKEITTEAAQPENATPQQEHTKEATPTRTDRQDSGTSLPLLDLSLSRGHFRTLAGGESLLGDVKDYYLLLVEKVNERWWDVAEGMAKDRGNGEVMVNLVIGRNGEVLDVNLLKSSGSNNYDRAVLTTLKQAGPLPPVPAGFRGQFFQAPLRLVAPLKLLAS